MRRKRIPAPPDVRRTEQHGDRCPARHPNWSGVRCERQASIHITHHSEGRRFEWLDERTAY